MTPWVCWAAPTSFPVSYCSILIFTNEAQPFQRTPRSGAGGRWPKDQVGCLATQGYPSSYLVLAVLLFVYLMVGLAVHLKWQADLEACRQARLATGQFVEPAVFWWPLALAFDVTNWPAYAWAHIYHFRTPFATPRTH